MVRGSIPLVVLALAIAAGSARAQAPAYLPLQGVLTDANDAPITTQVDVRFSLHTTDVAGVELWSETQSVLPEAGLFTVYLGQTTALDLITFRDHGELWLEVKVGTDEPMGRVRLGSTAYTAFAEFCGPHEHAFDDVTSGTVPLTALPAGVVRGPLACTPGDVVTGFDSAGAPVCGAADGLTEADVEAFVTNGALDLATGTTVGGQSISTGAHTTSLPWTSITDPPAGLADGDDVGVGGAGTPGRLAMFTTAAAVGDSEVIQNVGNVGIGTVPWVKLQVARTEAGNLGQAAYHPVARFFTNYANGARMLDLGNSWWGNYIQSWDTGTVMSPIALNPAGGAVGIGTTAPDSMFQVGWGSQRINMSPMYSATLGYATAYVGLNAAQTATDAWVFNSDGANNGGAVMYSGIGGTLNFAVAPSVGNWNQTLTDAQLAANRAMTLTGTGAEVPGALAAGSVSSRGDVGIGTWAGDPRHLRIGGGNSYGYLYGNFTRLGDGIHIGYNYFADSAGNNQIPNPGGGTSRISMGYGGISLATGPVNVPPSNRVIVDTAGNVGIGVTPIAALHLGGAYTSLQMGSSVLPAANFGFLTEYVGGVRQLSIYNGNLGSGTVLASFTSDGAFKGPIGPNGGAPFPRPAYDSGWVVVPTSGTGSLTLTHNIGGDETRYVVDLTRNWGVGGVTNSLAAGGAWADSSMNLYFVGVNWSNLTSSSVVVNNLENSDMTVRIRIWRY